MTKVFSKTLKIVKSKFPTTIYYAFKQSKINDSGELPLAGLPFLEAVISSGFEINATWPVRTELVNALKNKKMYLQHLYLFVENVILVKKVLLEMNL